MDNALQQIDNSFLNAQKALSNAKSPSKTMIHYYPVMMIESDPVDALHMRQTLEQVNTYRDVVYASTGEEALVYLQSHPDALPSLILLDLELPDVCGLTLLKKIKTDPILCCIPVVVLTHYGLDHAITTSFDLGVAGYILKSDNTEEMMEKIEVVAKYWNLSMLPAMGGSHCEDPCITSG